MNMVELAHDLAGIPPQDRLDGMARVVDGWRREPTGPKKCGRCYGSGSDNGKDPCIDCDGLGSVYR